MTADGLGTNAIIQRRGKGSKATVWRWQQRFGTGRAGTRDGSPCRRQMRRSDHEWAARIAFGRGRDIEAGNVAELGGELRIDSQAHVVVLSVDEKSQTYALDRTQGGYR